MPEFLIPALEPRRGPLAPPVDISLSVARRGARGRVVQEFGSFVAVTRVAVIDAAAGSRCAVVMLADVSEFLRWSLCGGLRGRWGRIPSGLAAASPWLWWLSHRRSGCWWLHEVGGPVSSGFLSLSGSWSMVMAGTSRAWAAVVSRMCWILGLQSLGCDLTFAAVEAITELSCTIWERSVTALVFAWWRVSGLSRFPGRSIFGWKFTGTYCVVVPFGITLERAVMGAGC